MARPKNPPLTNELHAVPRRMELPHGPELYHRPSSLARQLWYYVRYLGRARHDATFRRDRPECGGFLLHFLIRGRLAHHVREQTFVAGRGDVCLFDLSEPVSYKSVSSEAVELYWLVFDGKDAPRVFQELGADRAPLFAGVDDGNLRQLFEQLIARTGQPSPAYEPEASAILAAILAELFKVRPPRIERIIGEERAAPLSEPIRKAIDFVDRFYHLSLPVKSMAAMARLNLNYFSRRFHQEIGISPTEYLNRYRIEQARRLLESSDKTIAEIARSVGFSDQGYFARTFTRVTDLSPREYRVRSQKKVVRIPR